MSSFSIPTPKVPAAANPPTLADPSVLEAAQRARAVGAAGAATSNGTIGAMGPQGLTTQASTAPSTLLGG